MPLNGNVGNITNNDDYVFVGPTGTVNVGLGQKLTGAAVASLGTTSATAFTFNYGLCYQSTAGGPIRNFVSQPLSSSINNSVGRSSWSAAASTTSLNGSFNVGFCVSIPPGGSLTNNNAMSGWVMVTN